MSQTGLFVGLTTLDLLYLVDRFPGANEKIVAVDTGMAAGGPATNGAVAFAAAGNRARLLSAVGEGVNGEWVRVELAKWGVEVIDLAPPDFAISLSSIIITEGTGERAVISLNTKKFQGAIELIPPSILAGVDVVLIDGHLMAIGGAIASQAKTQGIPIVIDAGSWKTGFEKVLSLADYVIASANFYPPGCQNSNGVFAYLENLGVDSIAITNGEGAIQYQVKSNTFGKNEGVIAVPQVQVVDTTGAGDILHGAFCHYLPGGDFPSSLQQAAQIATYSCQFLGTRTWIEGCQFH